MCFVETRDPRVFLCFEGVDICEADVRPCGLAEYVLSYLKYAHLNGVNLCLKTQNYGPGFWVWR